MLMILSNRLPMSSIPRATRPRSLMTFWAAARPSPNPDTGMTQMTYDLASNVIKKVTANLQALGKAITYNYDPNNRLTNITYPLFTRNNVTYTYGTAAQGGQGNGNVANRIAQVTDGSGTELRLYDALGNIVKETKILQVPDEPNEPYHFGTDFAGLGNLSDGHGRDNNNYLSL